MPAKFVVCCLLLTTCLAGCRPKQNPDEEKSPKPPVDPLDPTPPAKHLDPPTGDTPATYKVRFECSHGNFVLQVNRKWAPRGADRFYQLVKAGFYDGNRFFRVATGFVVQWGINGDPSVQAKWREARIPDDPMRGISNKRGRITFANSGPNSRTAQVFINFSNNVSLDNRPAPFAPFGEVIEGMKVVDTIYSGYGQQPDQSEIQANGNKYLNAKFPKLDYIKKAVIVESEKKKPETGKTTPPKKTSAEKTPAKTKAEKTSAKTPAKTK